MARKVPEGIERNYLNDKRFKKESDKKNIDLKCKFCGKIVTKKWHKVKTFKYCSLECREAAKRKIHHCIHWKVLQKVKYVDLTCQNPDCKKKYKRTEKDFLRNVGSKYCSRDCYHHHIHLKSVDIKIKDMDFNFNKSNNKIQNELLRIKRT